MVEIAASGSADDVNALLHQLQQSFPNAEVHAVRQVTEGEANILGKTRSTLLSSSAFIVCTAALCVLATLMGWVFDRRRDFAIMKALGASDLLIAMFVAGEAAALACVGAIAGICCWRRNRSVIGRINFNAPVAARLGVFPPVLLGCLAVTLIVDVAAFAIAAPHPARYDFEGRVMIRIDNVSRLYPREDGGSRRQ